MQPPAEFHQLTLALIQFVASLAGFCLTKKVSQESGAYLPGSLSLCLSLSLPLRPFINLFKFCGSHSNLTAACQLLQRWPPQQLQSNSDLTR